MTAECELCGTTDGLEEHHKLPQRFGGIAQDWNIVTLCRFCHKTVEQIYSPDFWPKAVARYAASYQADLLDEPDPNLDLPTCERCGRPWTPAEDQAGVHTCRWPEDPA